MFSLRSMVLTKVLTLERQGICCFSLTFPGSLTRFELIRYIWERNVGYTFETNGQA